MNSKKIDVKLNVINVCTKILKVEGYQSLTMRAIAKECKLSLPILYRYFETKDALMLEICRLSLEQHYAKVEFLKNNSTNFAQEFVSEVFEFFTQNSFVFDYIYKNGNSFSTNIFRKVILQQFEEVFQNILKSELIYTTTMGKLLIKRPVEVGSVATYLSYFESLGSNVSQKLLIKK